MRVFDYNGLPSIVTLGKIREEHPQIACWEYFHKFVARVDKMELYQRLLYIRGL